MLNGPRAFELEASLTIYVVHPVTSNCSTISVLHPGALLVTRIEYMDIRCFY
jgi:hypothetical protein